MELGESINFKFAVGSDIWQHNEGLVNRETTCDVVDIVESYTWGPIGLSVVEIGEIELGIR